MSSNWWAARLTKEGGQTGQVLPRTTVPSGPPPSNPSPPVRSQRQDDYCPACSSTNYMAPPGTKYMRCFDCGYPLQQSGTGVGTTKIEGASKAATQVPTGSYQPQTVIGRVE